LKRFRTVGSAMTLAAIVAILAMSIDAVAQSRSPAAAAAPKKLPDGQPDIQGIWGGSAGGCSIETGICPEFFTGRPQRAADRTTPKSVVTDPADGKIPYQPWAAARRAEIAARVDHPVNRRGIDSRVLCFNGPPRSMYTYAYNIVQTPGYVIFAWEWSHLYRVIPLSTAARPDPGVKLLMGSSRGRWEGNTLVVETSNLNDWSWFDDMGTFHSDAMSVVERFTVQDANRIAYKATITDPKVFTRPWTIELPITHRSSLSLPMAAQGDTRFTVPTDDPYANEAWEHACVEGERAVETMLENSPR